MAAEVSVSASSSKRRKVVAPSGALASALPDEMTTEVLLRLPIKSILRFRAVSRTWAALLSSEEFCGLHMVATAAAPPKLLFVSPTANVASTAVYYYCSPLGGGHGHDGQPDLLTLPYASGNSVDVAPAPCHGLTLLYYAPVAGARAPVTPAYYVCNAATRAVARLPPCQKAKCATAGLGFDARTREYKVVRLFQRGLVDDVKCEVYTLGGKDRWRPPVAGGVRFRFCKFARAAIWHAATKKVPPVFVDGFLHWLIEPEFVDGFLHWLMEPDRKLRAAVISFSVTSETFSWGDFLLL